MYTVYILHSKSAGRYYIGQTRDISDRLRRHNSGYEKSTQNGAPWILLCQIEKATRSEAMKLERKLKNLGTERLQTFIIKYCYQSRATDDHA